MKKTLYITLASIALLSCSQDETVATMDRVAIEFDKVFVENSTSSRAATDITLDNLYNFSVYGSVVKGDQEGNIFNEQKVEKTAGGYTYSPAQYWIPSASYHFTAIAPHDGHWTYACKPGTESTYGTKQAQYGTITFDNGSADAEQDLLWAYQTAETVASISESPEAVNFSFQHMLSRAKFTFKNGFAEGSNISLKIKDVTITNAHKVGTIELNGNNLPVVWTVAEGTAEAPNTFEKNFGDANGKPVADYYGPQTSANTDHYYLIPVEDASYTIEFSVDLYQAGVLLQENIAKTAQITSLDMKRGYSYEFKAELNASNTSNDGALEAIEFNVTGVQGWTEASIDANITTQTPSN